MPSLAEGVAFLLVAKPGPHQVTMNPARAHHAVGNCLKQIDSGGEEGLSKGFYFANRLTAQRLQASCIFVPRLPLFLSKQHESSLFFLPGEFYRITSEHQQRGKAGGDKNYSLR